MNLNTSNLNTSNDNLAETKPNDVPAIERLLVYAGLLGLVLAASLWIFAEFTRRGILPAAPYFQEMPIRLHADLMFGLFLLPLLSAFLFYNFRSVSNETYVYPFKRFPIVYGGLTLLLFPLSYPGMILYFHALSLLLLIGLSWLSMAYSGGKYGKVMPSFEEGDPRGIFISLQFGIFGLWAMFFATLGVGGPSALVLGRHLIFFGMLPIFFLALSPRLLRPQIHSSDDSPLLTGPVYRESKILTLLIALSFFPQIPGIYLDVLTPWLPELIRSGFALRLLLILYWAIRHLQIHKVDLYWRGGILSMGVWMALWLLPVGLLGFLPANRTGIHLAHLFFLGSLVLFVMVSIFQIFQGESLLGLSRNRKIWLWLGFIFVILAALTRGTAQFMPRIYLSHLTYSAGVILIALLFWWIALRRKNGPERDELR